MNTQVPITPAGYKVIEAELKERKTVTRPEIVESIATARASAASPTIRMSLPVISRGSDWFRLFAPIGSPDDRAPSPLPG